MGVDHNSVILIYGRQAIDTALDVTCTDPVKIDQALRSIEKFEFSTPDEAEAFRLGLCVSSGDGDREFCEITESILKRLRLIFVKSAKRRQATVSG